MIKALAMHVLSFANNYASFHIMNGMVLIPQINILQIRQSYLMRQSAGLVNGPTQGSKGWN